MILFSTFIFFLIMMVGGVACTIWGNGRFEEGLPIGQGILILIMFFFGLIGMLRLSVIVILVICVGIFVCVLFVLCTKPGDVIKRMFTPAFFIYIAVGIGLVVLNYGKMLCAHDEFSHWGDVVHGMSVTGLLSFEPELRASFPEYVPGVSLIEYLVIEISRILGRDFTEWQLYYAFQLFLFSMFLPFFSGLNFKKPLPYFSIGALFLIQTFFQDNAYTTIYVDVMLSVFYGVGMAMLFQKEECNELWRERLILIISLLPLIKNTGLLFAISLFLCFFYNQIRQKGKAALPICIRCFCLMIVPTVLWNIMVREKGVQQAFGFAALFSPSPRNSVSPTETARKFFKALFTRDISSQTSLMPHLSAITCFAVLFVLILLITKEHLDSQQRRLNLWILGSTGFAYAVGICIIMCFSFTEEEIRLLSSFERYINIYFNALALTALLLTLKYVAIGIVKMRFLVISFAICAVLFTPFDITARFLTRRTVTSSQQYREYSMKITEKFKKLGVDKGRVLIIFDNYDYMEHIVIRSCLRPLSVSVDGLSKTAPNELKKQFDYVLLYRIDNDFAEKNRAWFEECDEINEGGIFTFDGEKNLLVRIDDN